MLQCLAIKLCCEGFADCLSTAWETADLVLLVVVVVVVVVVVAAPVVRWLWWASFSSIL